MKIKVCWEHSSMNDDAHYGEDNPDADYPNEVLYPATWTTTRYIEEKDSSEIEKIFGEEDGDYDFGHAIMFITDANNKLLFAVEKITDRKVAEEILIERLKEITESEKIECIQ